MPAANLGGGRIMPRPPVQDMALSEAVTEALSAVRKEQRGEQTKFFDWAMRVPEPKAGTLDFKRFPPQLELYKETVDLQDLALMKGTQIGISAYLVRWAMYWPDTHPVNALYVFPRARQMFDFSAARINPAVRASEYLRGRVRDTDNLGLKRIGRGYLYLRGSEAVEQLDSVDADVLALDEYDTLKHANIPDAERRISGSNLGLIRRVGVPSIPDFGIAKLYEQSDKRQWHIRCGHCGDRQPIDFFDNVDKERLIRVCRSCRKSIEEYLAAGEWVAEHPDRARRGYHLSRLVLPEMNLTAIVEASEKTAAHERQVFHNKDLGLPYAPEEGRLSESALEAATSIGGYYQTPAEYRGANLVTMGIDVASARPLTVRISEHVGGGKKRALFLGELTAMTSDELLDDLGGLMNRFGVHMAVIDHLPEGKMARAFAERFPGRVYIVSYSTNLSSPEWFKIDDEMRHVTVRRLDAIDEMMALVRGLKNHLPRDQPENYRAELKALIRVVTQDENGKMTAQYISTGPDDFAHAEVYDVVATMCWVVRQTLASATGDVYTTADDHVQFDRVNLGWGRDEPMEVNPGEYDEGPGDEYDYGE